MGHIDYVALEAGNGPQVPMEDHTKSVAYGVMGNLTLNQNRKIVWSGRGTINYSAHGWSLGGDDDGSLSNIQIAFNWTILRIILCLNDDYYIYFYIEVIIIVNSFSYGIYLKFVELSGLEVVHILHELLVDHTSRQEHLIYFY